MKAKLARCHLALRIDTRRFNCITLDGMHWTAAVLYIVQPCLYYGIQQSYRQQLYQYLLGTYCLLHKYVHTSTSSLQSVSQHHFSFFECLVMFSSHIIFISHNDTYFIVKYINLQQIYNYTAIVHNICVFCRGKTLHIL